MSRTHGGEYDLSTISLVVVLPVFDFGGIESRTVIHVVRMAEVFGDVRVCTFSGDGRAAADMRRHGITVDVLGTDPGVRNLVATYRLWRYLRHQRPDIVHGRSGAMTVHGLVAGRLAGVPVRIAEEVGMPARGRVGRWIFPVLYRLASVVVGVSDAVVGYLVEHDGVPEARAIRIHNAIDDRFFEVEPQPDQGQTRILAVGRLVPVKAHDVLLRAAAPLLQADPSLVLTIAGEGGERKGLEFLVNELGIESSVEFLGYRSDIRELLATADVFVLCSYSEGLPLSLVEAMAARVPIVATHAGGIAEVVPAEAVASLLQPGDVHGLEQALRDVLAKTPSERQEWGDALREHALANFSASRYANDLVSLYGRLLSRKRWL